MTKTVYICSINGVIQPDCYISLKGACESIGVNYDTARNRIREFKGGKSITSSQLHQSNKVGNTIKFDKDKWKALKKLGKPLDQEQQRMEDWRNDLSMDEA